MVLIRTTKPVSYDHGHFRPLGSASEYHPVFASTYQRRARVSVDGVGVATGETMEEAWDRLLLEFKIPKFKKPEKVNWKKEGF